MQKAPQFKSGPDRSLVFKPIKRVVSDAGRKARHRFYCTAAWRRCRALKLKFSPLCERCRRDGEAVKAEHVHHIIDLADAWHLRLVMSNLEALCHSCHSRETLKRLREEQRDREEDASE